MDADVTEQPQVKLLFTGDFFPGDSVATISSDLLRLGHEADLVFANIEGPLAAVGVPLEDRRVHLRSLPQNAEALRAFHLDVACLANNHTFDWTREGLKQCLATLHANGIRTLGAGPNRTEAERPLILDCNGVTIGAIAVGEHRIGTWPAQEDGPGCAVIENRPVCETVASLRAQTDVVVVSIHWGCTNCFYPLPEHRALGRALLEAGATLVIGHHPHVIQGVERIGNGAIVYSLGDCVFGLLSRSDRPPRYSRENRFGMLCSAHVNQAGLQGLRFFHTRQIDPHGSVELQPPHRILSRERVVRGLGKPFGRVNYARWFRRYAARRLLLRAARWLNPAQWREFNLAYVRALWASIRLVLRR